MRFEISYRSGTTHEVELPGSVAVFGRDPACDVVLNDSKCSRRHAVVEDSPEGIVVRDSGSANGVFVNGKRVERAVLRPGDSFRLGDVDLRLLVEVGETVVVAPEDLEQLSVPAPDPPRTAPPVLPATSPRVVPPIPREPTGPRRRPAPPRARPHRPATVTVLAVLWALGVPVSIALTLAAASRAGGVLAWTLATLLCLVLAGVGAAMAVGLRSLAPWARHLQIASAAVGLVVCPFTLASATVLLYMTRPEVRAMFEGSPRGPERGANGASEATFALSLVGMLVLGLALSAAAVLML